uniref:Uncharacterized protein n=1 Tax=Tanacetum cinerariifolium TaxID=118510 RepID=A0A6L2N5F9_TANCI|nr:hypothetical protein [Tanacetum cinerariifolium]
MVLPAKETTNTGSRKQTDARSSFNELLDTPIDFSNFIMNQLGVDTLTLELLAGLTYELMRGSCNSLTELEYHLEEVYKATTDQLDWDNPEGQQYPHNLLQPLPLILDNRGRRVIPFEHFINNDLEYLRGGASSRKYTTSVTKTKAAVYGHIKWIEDLVPRDFKRLRLQDIKDMLLLLVQGKLSNLTVEERFTFNVSLRMFTRSIVIQRRMEDLQLGVESYQKRLNLTKSDTYRSDLKRREALMRIDELYKFSDGTLNDVRNALDDRLKGIRMRKVLLMLEILSMRFFLKLNLSDHRSILTDLQGTLKGKWRYLIPAKPPIHNHVLIPNYQDFKIQDFCYSDGFECFQAIKIGRFATKTFALNWTITGEEYDKEREMEPTPARVRETTYVLRTGSPCAQSQRGRVVEFKDAPNMDVSRVERESKGSIVNYEDLKAKFRSNMAVHNIKQMDEESTKAFVIGYIDDTL